MNINNVYSPRPGCRGRVIALHSSGAGASQWCHFEVSALIARYIVDAGTNRRPLRWRPRSLAEIFGAAARPTGAVS
jgi:hypothetical protein